MSEQQNEQEGIRMMDLLKDAIHRDNRKWNFKEMSQQDKVHEGTKIVDLIKKGYPFLIRSTIFVPLCTFCCNSTTKVKFSKHD